MTKLLMLITSLAGGGAERVASELSLNLSPSIDRQIVTLTDEVSYPSNKPPLSLGIEFRKPLALSFVYAFLRGVFEYKKLLREHKPEYSLSFLTLDNFINIVSNYGNRNTKTVISVHIALSMKFRNSLKDKIAKIIVKKLYNKADLVIAVSEGVRNELIKDFKINPDKVKVLYNPVDVNKIKYLSREVVQDEKWFSENIPIIINVGRLAKQKGQWHLIRAFSKVREQINCRLVIRGNGELKPYLQNLVDELHLTKDVIFLEWKDNPFKYISKATVFASSSLWEALPYALTETMACGCPIISTNCKYGPQEILGNNEYGILVPPMDGKTYTGVDPLTAEEISLAESIIKLLKCENLRSVYSAKSLERASEFELIKCIEKYEKCLYEI
ncbi:MULTISPECIES: glycosyltransferase [Methanosarcina]|uniref:glycosyltransferase n=1 Tax=Methanosarcina TaxID=2207 RepID=UPI000AA04CE8|nr:MULTISPECIES: glycosyltransferase [Methanosarcina]